MADYSQEALDKAKSYAVGEKPNEVYFFDGKLVVIYALGGEYVYTDNVAVFDAMTGRQLGLTLFDVPGFLAEGTKLT